MKPIPPSFTEEDAFHVLLNFLKNPVTSRRLPTYGYEIYMPTIIHLHLVSEFGVPEHEVESYIPSLSPHFYAAAWELCRRGILRPGIIEYGKQATADGGSGNGYSITPRGRIWLTEARSSDVVPTETGRFSKILDGFSDQLGQAYRERSQEALRCYGAHAYLACCAMCGAAAEAILLELAVAKSGDEEGIIREYLTKGGRGRTENFIVGKKPQQLQEDFRASLTLLKYWRDVAAHGTISSIEETEAFTSLAILLRLARLTSERWDYLVKDDI
jgi:hypothetical protein